MDSPFVNVITNLFPKLLKQTRQSLKSVLSQGDLQNFVLKKRYHRLEYLQRLTATVCGILIYNNCDPTGERENMRASEYTPSLFEQFFIFFDFGCVIYFQYFRLG